MNKGKFFLWGMTFGIIFICQSIPAQIPPEPGQIQNTQKVTAQKMRLLVLPSKVNPADVSSIENEVTSIIVSTATQLGRFEVIDRNLLGPILEEQAIQLTGAINDSMVVKIGQIATAKEAMVVNVLNFSQKGVPRTEKKEKDDDDNKGGFWEGIFKSVVKSTVESIISGSSKDEPYANNIETVLSVEIRKLDIETGRSLQSIPLEITYTGGTRGKSRTEAMIKLRDKANQELMGFYKLTSEVIAVEGGEVFVVLGANVGVKEGMVFEIVTPEKEKTYGDRMYKVPGRRVGFISVDEPGSENNRSRILRQWRPIEPGYQALEHQENIFGIQVDLMPNLYPSSYFAVGAQFRGRPLHTFDWGIDLRIVQIKDSFGQHDTGFGLNGFVSLRFINWSHFGMRAKLGLGFDLAFRRDDQDHSVDAIVLNVPLGLDAEILLSPKTDLVVSAGYRLGGKTDSWTYSLGEDKGTKSASWVNGAPGLDISGYFLSVGLKFLVF